jgi:acyl dehydratase
MALDQSFTGRTYPPTPVFEVGVEKIREFADAIGDPEPAYRDPDAARRLGHPEVIAPPTFPIVVSMMAWRQIVNDPELGLDYSRVVHGDQRFTYVRPVRAGDRLTCVCTVEEVMSRGSLDVLTIRTDVSTEAGEPVVTSWGKLAARGEPA